MKRVIFSILLVVSPTIFAEEAEFVGPPEPISPIEVSRLFDATNKPAKVTRYQDLVVREEKISACIGDYKDKQTKSYAKIPQNDLYDLFHNFGKIVSRVYGEKPTKQDEVPYEEKLEALATLQCEAYYDIGVLK